MWAIHSQMMRLLGAHLAARAGASVISRYMGEDAGLRPHGARTPTPREAVLREPCLRQAVKTTPGPAFVTPVFLPIANTIGNARFS